MLKGFPLPLKVSLFSLLMTLIAVLVALSVSFYQSDQLLRQQAMERLADDLQREQDLLENHLRVLINDAHFLASSPALQGMVRASAGQGYDDQQNMTLDMWQERLAELFRTVLQEREAYVAIELVKGTVQAPVWLKLQRNERGIRQYRSSTAPHIGADFRPELVASQPAASEAPLPFLAEVRLEREQERIVYPPRSVLEISLPVYEEQVYLEQTRLPRELFAVVIIRVDLDLMLRAFYNAPENIEYFMATTRGEYLLHPDPQRRMAFERSQANAATVQQDFPGVLDAAGDGWQLLQRYMEHSGQGVALRRYQLSLPHRGDVEFWLGARAELAWLRVQSDALQEQMLLLALFLLMGVTLATLVMGRVLTRPILGLKQAADRISAGAEDVYLDTRGNDEVASLARSLQTMLQHLDCSRQQLATLNRSLEDKVSQRTLELESAHAALESSNEELARALSEAEQAAVAKSQFLASMSHEIRTPLNGVLGMTELMMATSLDSRQRDYLETVRRSGNTLLNLLNDILDFSRLEAGKLSLRETAFNPNEVVEHSLQLFAELAWSKGLELIPVTLPRLPTLLVGDPDRLGQVLMNLVSNAIKFTGQGEVVLSVRCLYEDDSQMRLRFSVQDTGIGIPADQQEKLFEQFVQADGTSTRRHGGTGLGLAISRQLVTLMSGVIELQSVPGEGTTVWFDLVLNKGPALPEPERARTLLQGRSVLVVDDNRTNRELLQEMTTAWGMSASQAADASMALHLLQDAAQRGRPIELILLDHMMPGQNGLALAQELSMDESLCQPDIILLTSIADHLPEEELKAAGIRAMLPRPVRQSQLYNQIVGCLETEKVIAQSVVAGEASESELFSEFEQSFVPVMVTALPPPAQADCTDITVVPRLLLVEDTPLNQRVALGMLDTLGYRADLVCNGQQAVEQVLSGEYSLVFMDLEMPLLDGMEATSRIREYEQHEGLPAVTIVALTAHALGGDRERCLAAGMDDYLSKPLTLDALQNCLQRWLPGAIERKSVIEDGLSELVSDTAASEISTASEIHAEAVAYLGKQVLNVPILDKAASDKQVLDKQVLEQLRQGLGDEIIPVLQLFVTQWPQLLDSLQQHLQQQERESLRADAHRLKGSCRSLGVTQAADLALQLEQLALDAPVDQLDKTLQALRQLESHVLQALRRQIIEEEEAVS